MARTRGPGNLVAQRPPAESRSDTRAHADYDAMIAQDLGGRRQNSYRAIDDGRPVGAAELLLRPISLLLFACTAFVIVLVAWLWQAGVFGDLQLRFTRSEPVPSSSWIGGRQARNVQPVDAEDMVSPSSPNTPAATPADAAPSDDDAAATANDGPDDNATE